MVEGILHSPPDGITLKAGGRSSGKATRIARVLKLELEHPERQVHLAGLDRVQSKEAWFARLAEMRRRDKRHDRFRKPERIETMLKCAEKM